VYAAAPPPSGWQRVGGEGLQRWVGEQPQAELALEPDGAGTLEAHTVLHGRDGEPERGAAMGRLADGRRFLAVLPADRAVLAALESHEGGVIAGTVRTSDERSTFTPR
jgi:acetyl-CoA C-acetyltransferase